MMQIMLKHILCVSTIVLITACATSRPNSTVYDPPIYSLLGLHLDQKRGRSEFDAEKSKIESYAHGGAISWVDAANRVRELDKRFAARSDIDIAWKYDYNDEEYYAFSVAAASLLDKKQITFIDYDLARTRKLSEISNRQVSNARPSIRCTTRVVSDRLVTNCQ